MMSCVVDSTIKIQSDSEVLMHILFLSGKKVNEKKICAHFLLLFFIFKMITFCVVLFSA